MNTAKILDLVRDKPGITSKEMAATLGGSPSRIRGQLKALAETGILHRHRIAGVGFRYGYRLPDAPPYSSRYYGPQGVAVATNPWPDLPQPALDTGKRYYVTSVSGYPTDAPAGRSESVQPRIFQVLDRDDNHRLIREFDERDGPRSEQRKLKAQTLAHRLNREEETAAA